MTHDNTTQPIDAAQAYLRTVQAMLDRLGQTQSEAIDRAAQLCVGALLGGHHIYLSPAGTHAIHTEVTARAGGFVDPAILSAEGTELRAGDVVIIGTNARLRRLAVRCGDLDVRTIAVTTVVYEQAIAFVDASGKTLHEVANVCIDQGGGVGDAVLEFPGLDVPIIPSSGVLCVAATWMVFAQAAEKMATAGTPPLVYQSIQMPSAVERNARVVAEPSARASATSPWMRNTARNGRAAAGPAAQLAVRRHSLGQVGWVSLNCCTAAVTFVST